MISRRTSLLLGLVALNALLLGAGVLVGKRGDVEAPPAVAPPPGQAPGRQARIGLVFDVGGLGDKSFNDAANRGLLRARDQLGVQVRALEPGDGSDRESMLRRLAAGGNDLVIGVGFIFSDDIRRLAAEFPRVHFACVDFAPPPDHAIPPNLAGLEFREHEASFLVGAAAGLVSKRKAVGFVGGMKIPLIRKFEAGYLAGVAHVCPECTTRSGYAGTQPKAFADPAKGKELALAQYDSGVDVIFHAAGKTGAGVFEAARARGTLAIGVDSDQYHEAPGHVLTSMIKKVDVAVFEVIQEVAEGRFRGGERELGLADDGVGYVSDANNRDLLPPEVVARLEELRAQIVAGTIVVPSE
jgi:basic membrane protein A